MRLGLWWALGLLRVSLTTLGPLRLDNRRRRVDLFTRRNNFLRRIGKLFYANVGAAGYLAITRHYIKY